MYHCPYCGNRLSPNEVNVTTSQSFSLSMACPYTEVINGKKRGNINWSNIFDISNNIDMYTEFTCIYCAHKLNEEEVENLISQCIKPKKKS